MTDPVEYGRRILEVEAAGILEVAKRLDSSFFRVASVLVYASTVHVSGVGKSGAIGRKIAGTMTSLGLPAFFLDPTEALHGDLGKIRLGDCVVLISRSGRCEEIRRLQDALRDRGGVVLVALTGAPDSEFARGCSEVVDCSVSAEADDLDLVPTASTAAALAVGDALALTVAWLHGKTSVDFVANHPAGAIGEDAAALVP